MKEIWKQLVREFEEKNTRKMTKGDFTGVFGRAFQLAFTPETVTAAFRATGVHPFDPSVITPTQMKPSEPSSVKGVFPLQQPSPVRAIMTAFRQHPPTTFDIDPYTHQAQEAEHQTQEIENMTSGDSTMTRRKRVNDVSIDPALLEDSPSK